MPKTALPQVLVVLFLLAALTSCGESKPAASPAQVVTVTRADAYQGDPGARYSADIKPYTQVNLAFRVGGYIEDILTVPVAGGPARLIQEGDRVRKGTVIARVRTTDYEAAVSQAKAKLAEAEANRAQAALDLERIAKLYKMDSVSKSEFDTANTKLEMSVAQSQAAKAVLRQAEISLGDTSLIVPADDVVTARNIELGSLVGTGTVAFVLADTTRLKAVFGVPDVRLGSLKLGDPIGIATEAFPNEEFEGRITRISPSADPKSRVFDVEITLPNPGDRLKIGMIASLTVKDKREEAKPPLVVPIGAIVRGTGQNQGYAVMVVERNGDAGKVHLRTVGIGKAYGNMIGVSDGLKAGEFVVNSGASLLTDGQAVRIAQ